MHSYSTNRWAHRIHVVGCEAAMEAAMKENRNANRLQRAPLTAITRCFDIACPSCGNADSRTYAWCRKRVFELVCGACSYAYDADEHGADLRAGVRVGL